MFCYRMGVSSLAEHLLGMLAALDSVPSTEKRKRGERKREREEREQERE
jgi:hypothetical protein